VQCSIATDGDVLALPVSTKLCGEPFHFQQWLSFPLRYGDLPLRSHLLVEVLLCDGPRHRRLVAGAAFPLFTRSRALHTGRQLIPLRWGQSGSVTAESRLEHDNELYRLARLRKQHSRGDIPEVSWLDSVTFERIVSLEQEQYRSRCYPNVACHRSVGELLLEVELPTFELPVQFYEQQESISAQLRSKSYYGKDARVRRDPQPKKGARTIAQLEPQSPFADFFSRCSPVCLFFLARVVCPPGLFVARQQPCGRLPLSNPNSCFPGST
jgi:Phosphoinositide 3-kinase C2